MHAAAAASVPLQTRSYIFSSGGIDRREQKGTQCGQKLTTAMVILRILYSTSKCRIESWIARDMRTKNTQRIYPALYINCVCVTCVCVCVCVCTRIIVRILSYWAQLSGVTHSGGPRRTSIYLLHSIRVLNIVFPPNRPTDYVQN